MKKVILGTLFCFGGLMYTKTVQAQSFSTQADTVKAVVYGYSELSDKVTNTASSGTIKISWKVVAHNLPVDWQSVVGICDNNSCYSNGILGTSATPPNPPFVPPGIVKLTDTISAGGHCDFHLQSDYSTCSAGGPYYIRLELTEGTTIKNITFALTKWHTGVTTTSKMNAEVKLYPNPAHGELNVFYEKNLGVKNIAISNMIGKVVSVFKVSDDNSAKLNTENLVSGVYIINLLDAQGHTAATKRFTVIQ